MSLPQPWHNVSLWCLNYLVPSRPVSSLPLLALKPLKGLVLPLVFPLLVCFFPFGSLVSLPSPLLSVTPHDDASSSSGQCLLSFLLFPSPPTLMASCLQLLQTIAFQLQTQVPPSPHLSLFFSPHFSFSRSLFWQTPCPVLARYVSLLSCSTLFLILPSSFLLPFLALENSCPAKWAACIKITPITHAPVSQREGSFQLSAAA